MHTTAHVWGSEDNLWKPVLSFSPSTTGILGIKVRSSALTASVFIFWTIPPAHKWNFFNTIKIVSAWLASPCQSLRLYYVSSMTTRKTRSPRVCSWCGCKGLRSLWKDICIHISFELVMPFLGIHRNNRQKSLMRRNSHWRLSYGEKKLGKPSWSIRRKLGSNLK